MQKALNREGVSCDSCESCCIYSISLTGLSCGMRKGMMTKVCQYVSLRDMVVVGIGEVMQRFRLGEWVG